LVDSSKFTIVIQDRTLGCWGAVFPVFRPTRVEVLAASSLQREAATLARELQSMFTLSGSVCTGPGGLHCWATNSPGVFNLVVVVCDRPDPKLAAEVDARLGRGFEGVGVVPLSMDPSAALPPSMKRNVAIRYSTDIRMAASDVFDLVVSEEGERRAFISYCHADGFSNANAIFDTLASRRFDVYLDRFRTAPGADFVQRIADELIDKAMIVLIESNGAISSSWIRNEIAMARAHHLGLISVNVDNAPFYPSIVAAQRIAVSSASPNWLSDVARAVETHHRTTLVDRRRRRLLDLSSALRVGRVAPMSIHSWHGGYDVLLSYQSKTYTIATEGRFPDIRRARRVSERAQAVGSQPVLVGPRPVRRTQHDDVAWLGRESRVRVIHDGNLIASLALLAQGRL
jgi:hypothetical protein